MGLPRAAQSNSAGARELHVRAISGSTFSVDSVRLDREFPAGSRVVSTVDEVLGR